MKKFKMDRRAAVCVMLAGAMMLLGGCGSQENTVDPAAGEMFTDRDFETSYDEKECVKIVLDGDSASCNSDKVKIEGSAVTVCDEGSYLFTGTLSDGQIAVEAEDSDKPQLVFDNVSVTSSDSAALYIVEADKVFVTQTEGSENSLINGGEFVSDGENNIDGAVFSKQDLTFNGAGTLTVTSPAGHGIVCKDDLVFTGGVYDIASASHGLDANDSIRTTAAEFKVASGKDGFHAENSDNEEKGFVYIADGSFDIEAEGDGISAGYYGLIEDGNFDIVSGGGCENAEKKSSDNWGGFMGGHGGPGMHGGQGIDPGSADPAAGGSSSDDSSDSTSIKGIKTDGDLTINGGAFDMDTADDALHSNTVMVINGGDFKIAAGDDAIHAEESLDVTAGTIDISESYEGLEALDIVISGGDISVTSSDDGLNAAGGNDSSGEGGRDQMGGAKGGPGGQGGGSSDGSIEINGGNIDIHASGDGIDSNGTLLITGGMTVVTGPTQGDTAVLDYDSTAEITGGIFIGTGAMQMAQTFSSSEQGVIAVSVGDQGSGAQVVLTDRSGSEIMTHTIEQSANLIILSSPDIKKGDSYTISIGSVSGECTAE